LYNPHACHLVSILSIRFSYKVIVWHWPFTNDLGSRSWHFPWGQCNNSVKYSISWTQWKVMARTMSKTTMGIVTLTSDLGSRLWHFLGSGVTILWIIIPIHAFSENLWPRQCLNHYEHSDLDLWLITLYQGDDISLGPGQQSCEILFKFIKRVRSYGPDKLFPCLNHYVYSDLGSRSWHFLGSSVTILWNIPIHAFSEKLWPGQCLNHYEHSDFDLLPITLNQGHDTSLGPGQQSCEILFKFIKRVKS
jgi:hypothetical protein